MPCAMSGSRSAGWPARSTGTIAFVLPAISSAARSGSMLRSESRTSAKTGVAPACTITFAVAGHVIGVVITSSPGPTPSATSERCSAAVPDASASTCSASRNSLMRSSSRAALGPLVSQPERSVAVTAAISSSPIAGGWKPSMVSLRATYSDESFDIDLEPNHRLRAVCAFERFLTALPDGQDRAGPVGAAPELSEAMAGTAVDPDPTDAVERERLLHAGHFPQPARRRDEEAHARAAHLRGRRHCCRQHVLAERRGKGGAVEVDAEGDAAELRVVAAAEARGQLADPRPIGPDEHLRIARPVLDPDRARRGRGRLDRRPDLRRLELARPHVRQRDAETRQRRRQPVGNGQRVEVPADRERIDGHLATGDELLDEQRRTAGGVECDPDRLLDLVRRADERQPALALPVGGLHDAGKADALGGLRRLARAGADLVGRLRHARLGEALALPELGR